MSYDVIVIGGGSVGVPITYYLAEKGVKVLCIEKHPSVGQGQNKSAIGGIRATHSHPAKIELCLESLRILSTWEERTGMDIDWKPGGYSFPVYREKEEIMLKELVSQQRKYGLNISWVDGAELLKIIPGIEPKGLRGGTYSPGDGMVSPHKVITSFAVLARKLGAEFLFNTEVDDIITENNEIVGVKAGGAEYHAPVVVNAAGAMAKEVGEMVGLALPVVPDSHEAAVTAPVREFLEPLVVDIRPGPESKTANFYFGQEKGGHIIFCYTPIDKILGTSRECTSEFMPIISNRLVGLMPRLKNLLIRRQWRGLYPMTPDGIPMIGQAGPKGHYVAVGMCGHGLMLGPGVGKNMAALITEGEPLMNSDDFDLLSPQRGFCEDDCELLD